MTAALAALDHPKGLGSTCDAGVRCAGLRGWARSPRPSEPDPGHAGAGSLPSPLVVGVPSSDGSGDGRLGVRRRRRRRRAMARRPRPRRVHHRRRLRARTRARARPPSRPCRRRLRLRQPRGTRARPSRRERDRGHPADKDATDLELALRAAQRIGATRVTVVGAGGGRLDHFLATRSCSSPGLVRLRAQAFVGDAGRRRAPRVELRSSQVAREPAHTRGPAAAYARAGALAARTTSCDPARPGA